MREVERSFAEEFERVLVESDTSVRRLARLTGISRRTLENWLYGRTSRPRHVEPILDVAQALHLSTQDTDRLLQAAGHPTLVQLKERRHQLPSNLLLGLQAAPSALIDQKSAALPAQHNLPAATTPFLGRQSAQASLADLIGRHDLRLVTVTGLGGTGKTRLSLETARSLGDCFDHGVYFVPLDNVNDAAGFWEAIVDGLDIANDGISTAQGLVEEYLRNKQILLVLDNFEHLLPLTAEIAHLLSRSEGLNLLVTSRAALDLQSEHRFPIGGLSFVEGEDSPAYQLFVLTARRRVRDYDPTPQERKDIAALCAGVDGLPLALELAATWSDVLSPAQMLDLLRSNLQEVQHATADRPERQQSLWNLFEYSWRMLSSEEQEAAVQLSVLRGTFTPALATAVASCHPEVLKRLVQTSLVRQTAGSRLIIHPLVRQFFSQQAVSAGYDVEALEDRFMEVTLDWVAVETGQLRETFNIRHLRKLHIDWQQIERAWWLAVDRRRYALLESCWDIIFYFEARGTWGQGKAFFESTRRQIAADERRMHARLDEAESAFAIRLFEINRSVELARRSLLELQALGVDTRTSSAGAYARMCLFVADFVFNPLATSEEIQLEFRKVVGNHLAKSADVLSAQGEGEARIAKGNFAGASEVFRNILDSMGSKAYMVPTFRCYLGISLRGEGLESAAREQFSLALERGLKTGMYTAVVGATFELQMLESGKASLEHCREALEKLAVEMGSRRTIGRIATAWALTYLRIGNFKRATQLMRIGVGLLWHEVDKAERLRTLSVIAQAYIAFGLIKHAPQVMSLVAPGKKEYGFVQT